MAKISRIHYHDHVDVCPQCKVAADMTDPGKLLLGGHTELMKIYDHSCEDGQNILMEFWMRYTEDE